MPTNFFPHESATVETFGFANVVVVDICREKKALYIEGSRTVIEKTKRLC